VNKLPHRIKYTAPRIPSENDIHAEPAGGLEVKGFSQPVKAYKVTGLVEGK